MKNRDMPADGSVQTFLIATSLSCGWLSMPGREGLETFSVMTAVGRKTLDRMIVMAAPYGRWEKCSAIREMQD
jgi:hypothetical protein